MTHKKTNASVTGPLSNEMENPSRLNVFLDDPLFAKSATCEALRKKPLGFVDVGARGGIHKVIEPLAGVTAVLGFEADATECEHLMAQMSDRSPWFKINLEPTAIAGHDGHASFNVLAREVNSSLLKPSISMAKRYKITGFNLKKTIPIPTKRLDSVLFGPRKEEDYWGELIKLDAQGAELDILHGALRTLKQRTVALIVEVEFCSLYEQQPLFSEVELFLRSHGFTFFGFKAMSHRIGQMRQFLSHRGPQWQERLLHADAIFFKDPLSGAILTNREYHTLFSSALLLGFYDFAFEVGQVSGFITKDIEMLIQNLAFNKDV